MPPLKELDASPELRDDPSLKDYNDVTSLAKSHKDTKAFVGSSIRPPGPDASPEAKKEFYEKLQKHAPHLVPMVDGDAEAEKVVWGKLGRPSKREEYEFKAPEGADLNIEALRDAAEAAGMTKKQFTALAEKSAARALQLAESSRKERETLQAEWGSAYETKLKNAAAVAQKLGEPDAVCGAILAGKMSSATLKRWDIIATAVGKEGKGVTEPRSGSLDPMTRDEAEAQFAEIQANPGYFEKKHPEHESLVRKAAAIMAVLHPG
jgi:hypothetical protein